MGFILLLILLLNVFNVIFSSYLFMQIKENLTYSQNEVFSRNIDGGHLSC